jgi:hypothetical protein
MIFYRKATAWRPRAEGAASSMGVHVHRCLPIGTDRSFGGREIVNLDAQGFRDARHDFERPAVLARFEIRDMGLGRPGGLGQLGLRHAAA